MAEPTNQNEEAKYNRTTAIVCYLLLAGLAGIPFLTLSNRQSQQAKKVESTIGEKEARFYQDLASALTKRLSLKAAADKSVWLIGLDQKEATDQLTRSGLEDAVAIRQSALGGDPARWDVFQCYSRLPKRDFLVVATEPSQIVWYKMSNQRLGFIVAEPKLPTLTLPTNLAQWQVVARPADGKEPQGLVGLTWRGREAGALIDPGLSQTGAVQEIGGFL